MMGDYNINYLNQREREDLETVTLPYGVAAINNDQPTRISNKSGSLMNHIITDHYNFHSFSSFVSDTPFRTSTNKAMEYFATSVISNIELQPSPKIFMKKSTMKSHIKSVFSYCNWFIGTGVAGTGQTCPERLFSILASLLEDSLLKSISKSKIFIRNDKSNLTIHQFLMRPNVLKTK